ncbi:type I-C CRISPR-associated protein Cas8c/Csd1 [Mesorhizobium sp. M0590]|uniref:type I-C CRISPR-associated protein Cas8c/Csd1 n=1 Tax=Mesorhizobium sp. M0590 TaxID=2956966 RepID=UPI0033374802
MSILASLAKAYDRLPDAPPFGYSTEKIGFVISLNQDGTVASVTDLRDGTGKKKLPRMMQVPASFKRPGINPKPFFLWDNSAFALGVTATDGKDALSRWQVFRDTHLASLAETNDFGLLALRSFIEKWVPEQFETSGWPSDLKDQNVVFALETERRQGGYLHDRPAAKALWADRSGGGGDAVSLCLVTGSNGAVARLHPAIKGVWGAQSSGASIVSFNLDAFTSYEHEQGDNAPVSEAAAFKYSTALNTFLAGKTNRIQVGDTSTVFWADASDAEVARTAEGTFGAMFSDVDEVTQAGKVGDILARIRNGLPLKEIAPELENGVRFYVLGLAPNAARLSIRFWFENDFGVLAKNYQRFVAEMDIDPPPRDAHPALWKYLAETAVLGKRENVPPNLAGEWMRSILTGTRYPLTLLSTVLMRIRADGEVSALRVGILKALLVRNFNKTNGEAPVSFEPENRNKGYLLGRLFAAYEQIQTAALGRNVNATIKDKFYGSASAQPRKVFALLDRGSANHLSKVGKQRPGHRINLEKTIGAILERMSPDSDPFPASLSAQEQALFGLGYYHQRGEFFRKPETVDTQDAAS